MPELVYHFTLIEWQTARHGRVSKQLTIVGHMQFTGKRNIPCIRELLTQQRELQHLPGDLHVSMALKLHHRKRSGRETPDKLNG